MAETDELDFENLDLNEPENVKRFREWGERQQKRANENEGLARENAFLKAGIDLSGRLGQAFAQTYDGKLDDVEAIRADAKDFDPRIVTSTSPEPAAEVTPGANGQGQGQENSGSAERQNLADGAVPTGEQGDVRKSSLARAKQLLDEGKELEVAAGELVSLRAKGVHEGTFPALDAQGRRVN